VPTNIYSVNSRLGESRSNRGEVSAVIHPGRPLRVSRIEASDASAAIWLSENNRDQETPCLEMPWFWLRDHSEDPSSYEPSTKQRTVDTFAIDRSIRPDSVVIIDNGQSILATWPGPTPDSTISARTLASLLPADQSEERTMWSTPDNSAAVQPLNHSAIVETDEGLSQWIGDIHRFGFALGSDSPTTEDGAEALANRLGYVRRTIFGDLWTLSPDITDHADTAYGAETLEPHTDGSYSHDAPGLQFFVCAERSGTGGESVLVDGFSLAEELRANEPDAFKILTEVSVPGHYIEPGVDLRTSRPTIQLDTSGAIKQVSFNNYDRSPFILPEPRLSQWYDAYTAFHELVIDQSRWWSRRLEPGDSLIFDNWRCLHGRMAYTGARRFNGGYLNHEDLESRIRVLSA